mmetsp:Transcript_16860/g.34127  ORF Transcript_16860/g.34127 Transcript_16860/m.34127 type:complete len:193 (-) Transcript_16860:41-619(-)
MSMQAPEHAIVVCSLLFQLTNAHAKNLMSSHPNELLIVWKNLFKVMELQKASTEPLMMNRSYAWRQRNMVLQLFGVLLQVDEYKMSLLSYFLQSTQNATNPGNLLTRMLQEHNRPVREFALELFVETVRTECEDEKMAQSLQMAKGALIVEFMTIFHTPVVQHTHDLSFITMLFRKQGGFVHIVNRNSGWRV